MSDLPQQNTINQYVADGVTTIYSYTYQILIDSDIQVYVTLPGNDPNENDDLKILSTDYTVQDAGNVAGGTITFEPASIPPNGATVTLRRNVENSLDTNFADARNFNGQNLDDALLRLMLCIQQNSTDIAQVVLRYQFNSFQEDEDATTNILPQLPEGWIWMGSASGGVVAVELEQDPDVSTLRSELENDQQGTDGAGIVGYYDETNNVSTTVRDFLNNIVNFMEARFYSTSDSKATFELVPLPGWILWIDSTIGSATSGADYANADAQNLFTKLWTNCANAQCPVSGGRGASAAADWAANKTLSLPIVDGRTLVNYNGTYTLASTFGEATHTLSLPETPVHNHAALEGDFIYDIGSGGSVGLSAGANATDNKAVTANAGGGLPHNNLQPSTAVVYHMKL